MGPRNAPVTTVRATTGRLGGERGGGAHARHPLARPGRAGERPVLLHPPEGARRQGVHPDGPLGQASLRAISASEGSTSVR